MIESLALIVSVCGMVLVVFGLRQAAKIHRQTTDAQIFLELTARFNNLEGIQKIIAHDDLDKPYKKSPSLDGSVCSYFDLLSQEYHLNQIKVLSDQVWNMWQDDIKRIITSPLMRGAWHDTVHDRYSHHSAFVQYVEVLLSS